MTLYESNCRHATPRRAPGAHRAPTFWDNVIYFFRRLFDVEAA